MKMYILIRKYIANEFAVIAAAHASLACYLKFQEDKDVKKWISGKFYKVICVLDDNELLRSRDAGDYVEITESKLSNEIVAIAFKPRENWPTKFNYYKLWR